MKPRGMQGVSTPTLNANPQSRDRKQVAWPIAGLAVGFLVGLLPWGRFITLQAGITALCAAMVLVMAVSARPIGARAGVLLAGLLLAVPCFLRATPLARGLLMCCICAPFFAAAALVVAPAIAGWRARLAYLSTWCGTHRVKRRARGFDRAALVQLLVATTLVAAATALAKAAPASGLWLPVRWLAGGIGVLAFAEMVTACLPFMGALVGLAVPPLMQSPYRSTSINEFWTRRWNIFASEKVFRPYCFAPLARRSAAFALLAAFALSGVGHALLVYMALGRWRISLVCGAFFLVQPLLIAAERRMKVRRWPPAAARGWTLATLTITSPLFVEPGLQLVESGWGGPDEVLLPTAAVLGFVIVVSSIISLASLAARPAAMAQPVLCPQPGRIHEGAAADVRTCCPSRSRVCR